MCDTVHLEDNMAEKTNVSLVFDTSDLPETMRNPQTQALIENMSKRASYSRNPAYQGDPRFRFFTEFEPGIYSARPEDSKYCGLSRLFDEWWGSLDDSGFLTGTTQSGTRKTSVPGEWSRPNARSTTRNTASGSSISGLL